MSIPSWFAKEVGSWTMAAIGLFAGAIIGSCVGAATERFSDTQTGVPVLRGEVENVKERQGRHGARLDRMEDRQAQIEGAFHAIQNELGHIRAGVEAIRKSHP